jgi:hypothetical protein
MTMNRFESNKQRACELAKALLANDVDYLDHIIDMWKIGNRLHGQVWNTEFHVFDVIESDTDHLPTKSVRPLCAERWQVKSDREIDECIELYRNQVTEACNEILAKYSSA